MSQFSQGSVGNDGEVDANSTPAPEAAQIEMQMSVDARMIAPRRASLAKTVALAGSSPSDVQLAFIKGLLDNPSEARKFTASPKDYAVEHGVLLDPDVVRGISDALLFDVSVDKAALEKLGPRGAQAVLDMRINNSVAAVPAAVVAGAAVVAAAAAVVEAVVTVVRASKVSDLVALKGLGPDGIRMPGGGAFRF